DYGTSWRVYRTISIVDQIYIKAKRIRTIQEKQEQKIGDTIASEFKGILNYAVMGLIQLELPPSEGEELSVEKVMELYTEKINKARELMLDKNHDYGEAWREMSQESFVDLMLAKLQRIRQILQNDGKTLVSEGIEAQRIEKYEVGGTPCLTPSSDGCGNSFILDFRLTIADIFVSCVLLINNCLFTFYNSQYE
ncbi:MAG: DUF1599 domain-containing protein, partial [Chitinophagaceae bacterium]|nr:DUF1599 domain-containing protein [Chitinophagaceae bacterium]